MNRSCVSLKSDRILLSSSVFSEGFTESDELFRAPVPFLDKRNWTFGANRGLYGRKGLDFFPRNLEFMRKLCNLRLFELRNSQNFGNFEGSLCRGNPTHDSRVRTWPIRKICNTFCENETRKEAERLSVCQSFRENANCAPLAAKLMSKHYLSRTVSQLHCPWQYPQTIGICCYFILWEIEVG